MVKVPLKTVQPIGTSKIPEFTSVILFKFFDSQDIEISVPFAVYAQRFPFTCFKIGMDLVGGSEKVTLQLDWIRFWYPWENCKSLEFFLESA